MPSGVVSWPPCIVLPEVNAPAGLPASTPVSHRLEVPSKNAMSGAAMLPKRTGLPSTSPAHSRRSSCVASAAPSAGVAPATVAPSGGHRAQARAAAGDAVDAARHLARELRGRAVAAVIEDEDVRHRALPSFQGVHRLLRHGF